MRLVPQPLNAEAFAPFGTLIAFDSEAAWPVNEGTALRADTAALFDHARHAAPVLALYRLGAQEIPLKLQLFERHPESSQSFFAISVPRFCVVVAPDGPDGRPDTAAARAFVGACGTGVSYRRDQWHTPVMAWGRGGDVLMLMAEYGDERDCVEHRLAEPLIVSASPGETLPHGP